ncbi:MAG: RluA family pseudouridine synthase [Proteobacteria bacterium]|nr:RluA family pseudouridine synthase [Pseudomonadota bacterium]
MENRFRIICDEGDKRLDVFLSEKLSITRTKVKTLIEEGHIRIAGKLPKPSLKTKKFMEIEGEIPEEAPLILTPQDIPLNILYEDEYILAIDKPKGMVVHPSFGHKEGTLVNAVLSYLMKQETEVRRQKSEVSLNPQFEFRNPQLHMRPGIVHRLDKGTTGVILVAKDAKTQDMLSSLFKERKVQKTYRAIVEGMVKKENGIIEGNIGRHQTDRKKMALLKAGGREAVTGFKVIQRLNGFTYIEAYPKTGRTHQIRVHLSHTGHPVVGDEIYGKKAKKIADRPLLHAYRIEFRHPVKDRALLIEAPVPEDMEEFIRRRQNSEDRSQNGF